MFKMSLTHPARIVQLSEQIKVETDIQDRHLPALRSGFAGYPANPRWDGAKFMTWKVGRQWRNALQVGTIIIRESDAVLIMAQEEEDTDTDEIIPKAQEKRFPSFLSRFDFKHPLVRFHTPQSPV
ncbi:MAG: hypothetical protein SAJ12_08015 [Jaaginema sp. PMC 1079.18]|nr:hypothetical protein [Jaaginema sp. PMC 1080.18]MEC4850943.1 hypothetical protein [Jaaginema sp. PMC 1079.18]MEC4867063.1 hypothetical protein [Jaaginema sp. PMC 1078.18]